MSKLIDLTGRRFGKLTVKMKSDRTDSRHRTYWLCECDCGTERIILGSSLRSGNTKSCGCSRRKKKMKSSNSPRQTHIKLYNIWHSMKQRCNDPNTKFYKDYGGRGIKVCSEWENSFESFAKWSDENGYSNGLEIDRIDNSKGYSPDNCKWSTDKEQANNRRNSVYYTIDGETKTLAQWCETKGLPYYTIWQRLNVAKWDVDMAFNQPVRITRHRKTET